MGCGLYPFQVKAIYIGGAIFVVFVHLTSAESHKGQTSFLCKQGKEALPEHMEPGRFQFAVSTFEGEMEAAACAARFQSPAMQLLVVWLVEPPLQMGRVTHLRVSSGSKCWGRVSWWSSAVCWKQQLPQW